MIQPAQPDLVPVNIDGREIAVPKGTNMIEAARLLGIEIPHYCYHPKLSIAGNCRMCLVEMGLPALDPATRQPMTDPATGGTKVNWMPRPAIACATNALPGLHIRTTTPLVRDCREGVMEFLLINHPLDCPVCDQAGECRLQEFATDYGRGYSRFVERKNVKPKRTLLGPRVVLDDERCILCSRCIRFCAEVAKDDVLGFIDRGSHSTLACYPGRKLENNYSLNTVDICPVGALTSTDFRFKMRVWFLKATPGICPESSVGVNTDVWSREGVIYRITPRRNDEVNDTWMADTGRELYKQVEAGNRLKGAKIDGRDTGCDMALKAAGDLLKAGGVAVVGSGRSSVEEQFLAKKFADVLKAPAWLVSRVGRGDGLLISADRNPNVRGALVTGLISELPESGEGSACAGGATPPARTEAGPPESGFGNIGGPTSRLRSASSDEADNDGLAEAMAKAAASAAARAPFDKLRVPSGVEGEVGPPGGAGDDVLKHNVKLGGLAELAAQIDAGKIKTVLSLGEDLAAAGLTAEQLAKVSVIYPGTYANATSGAARVVIPALTVFEKNGTFINQQFRIQKFAKAVPGPPGVADDLVTLTRLLAAAGGPALPSEINALWKVIAAGVKHLATVTYQNLPATGLLLDPAPWAALPFVEGASLHYKPAEVMA